MWELRAEVGVQCISSPAAGNWQNKQMQEPSLAERMECLRLAVSTRSHKAEQEQEGR